MKPLLLFLALVSVSADEVISVYAAASTTNAITEVAKTWMLAHPDIKITTSFGSSATLAKQIEQGAPADLFLSADGQWMDYLEERKALKPGSRHDVLANRLVLIASPGQTREITVTATFAIHSAFSGRFAIADPASVPAGIYAKEAFVALGWWASLAPRCAPATDVRAALRLVEMGECDLGVVYASDVVGSTVVQAGIIPTSLHRPIRYPLACTTTASATACAFADFLKSPEAGVIFTRYGFMVP